MNSTVKVEALGNNNYDTWKMHIEALLIKNDNWGYVNGSIIKPKLEDTRAESVAAVKEWEIADSKARADIILSIQPAQLKQIKNCATSNELWNKLKEIYQSKGPARKASLLKRLTLSKMKEGDDVRLHLAQFSDTVDKLGEMGLVINEDLLSIMLLYSLPESYETFRCAIETRDNLPNLENLKIKIVEEFEARKETARLPDGNDNVLFVGKKPFRNQNKNYTSNKAININKENFKFKCHFCGKVGHKIAECKLKQKKKLQENVLCTDVSNSLSMEYDNTSYSGWCLDSGCTSHMSHEEELLLDFIEEKKTLNLANNQTTNIVGKGDIVVNYKERNLRISETLLVPDLRTNLLSVAKMTDQGHRVIFSKNSAVVITKENEEILKADRINNLYIFKSDVSKKNNSKYLEKSENANLSTSLDEWHLKLAHLNERTLKKHLNNNGIDIKGNNVINCISCIQGKQVQLPFKRNYEDRTSEVLEIVHTDLCGPMRTDSLGRHRYFVVFIDDYSRWTQVYFLRSKTDMLTVFKEFKVDVENQTGRKIKYLQSDNGTETCNQHFEDYLKTCGIKRRLTVAYTPQQNGVAERKIRTLVEAARCMLLHANISKGFWAEAVNTANYIQNRCPSRSINFQTPFKLWFNRNPKLHYFQIFGAKAYSLIKSPGKDKFESKSIECIFIGYSTESKAYKLYVPSQRKVIVSRDVKFLNEFPSDNNQTYVQKDTDLELVFPNVYMEPVNREETPQRIEVIEVEPQKNEVEVDRESQKDKVADEIENAEENSKDRRRGRPKLLRTGKPGRPRKISTQDQVSSDEMVCIGEVSVLEALKSDEKIYWEKAIQDEIFALMKNKTWQLVEWPQGKNVVDSKIILRKKLKSNGSLDKYKARLVARGFSQELGVDYFETFSPVARLSSIRKLISVALEEQMEIHQMDVITAYLNGRLDTEVYMKIPDHYEITLKRLLESELHNTNKCQSIIDDALSALKQLKSGSKVCKLEKALYGLKQAGRMWYLKLDEKLNELGLKATTADPCVYSSRNDRTKIIVAIYVDDIIIASNDVEVIKEFKGKLSEVFEMKDLGKINFCVGIEFQETSIDGKRKMKMCQTRYIKDVLSRFGMEVCKTVCTPLDPSIKLVKPETPDKNYMKSVPYQKLIGSLLYISTGTRPDITFAVNFLSQFNTSYDETHWNAAKHVLRYLNGTKERGINFEKSGNTNITGFTDADWGNCLHDRRSYTGFVFKIGNNVVSWEARKQHTVALSSTEAEYMALSEAAKEGVHVKRFLEEIGVKFELPIIINNDNLSSQKIAKNQTFHNRTKHIDIRHHYIRELIANGTIDVNYIQSNEMEADLLTKPLKKEKTNYFVHKLRMQ